MTKLSTFIKLLLLLGYWFLIAGVTLRVLMKRRAVSSAIAWLLIIYIIPMIGIMTYLLFGELNLGKRRAEHSKAMWPSMAKLINKRCQRMFATEHSEVARSIFKLCEHRQGIGGLKGNKIELLTSTDAAMTAFIRDIRLAKHNIEMVFYIWEGGGLVDKVTEALIAAARRGVSCRIMLDSAGSVNFFRSSYPAMMRAAGINIVEALHVSLLRVFLRRMDLRQHRKIVLIDHKISYTGSMNMVDPTYFKLPTGVSKLIDMMARMVGPVTYSMGIIYSYDWEMETGERLLPPPPDINKIKPTSGQNNIQVIASGPGCPEGVIHQALLTSIYAARKQLVMTTPYLVPSDDLLDAICTAAQRGVEVHIIVPKKNDSLLVGWASRALFTELLDAGVHIHQFDDGLLHTKSVLVDKQLSLVGTVNLDMRSLWLNFEITIVIDDYDFGHNLAMVQQDYIIRSKLIDATVWSKRPYWQRIIERLCYFFSPLL